MRGSSPARVESRMGAGTDPSGPPRFPSSSRPGEWHPEPVPARPVSQPNRSPAIESNRQLFAWVLPPLVICPLGHTLKSALHYILDLVFIDEQIRPVRARQPDEGVVVILDGARNLLAVGEFDAYGDLRLDQMPEVSHLFEGLFGSAIPGFSAWSCRSWLS